MSKRMNIRIFPIFNTFLSEVFLFRFLHYEILTHYHLHLQKLFPSKFVGHARDLQQISLFREKNEFFLLVSSETRALHNGSYDNHENQDCLL